jgi:hypothetical protein
MPVVIAHSEGILEQRVYITKWSSNRQAESAWLWLTQQKIEVNQTATRKQNAPKQLATFLRKATN